MATLYTENYDTCVNFQYIIQKVIDYIILIDTQYCIRGRKRRITVKEKECFINIV